MTFLTLFILLIINFCWFYIYLAVQFTKEQLNGWLWSWFQIGFEPSDYIGVMLAIALASQLLLLAIIYGYSAHGRHIRGKFGRLKLRKRELEREKKEVVQVAQQQSKGLEKAQGLEQENDQLRARVAELEKRHRGEVLSGLWGRFKRTKARKNESTKE